MPPYVVLNVCKMIYRETASFINSSNTTSPSLSGKGEGDYNLVLIGALTGLIGGVLGALALIVECYKLCRDRSGNYQTSRNNQSSNDQISKDQSSNAPR